MIDQTSQFFAILTNIGAAKQANADALGIAWKIAQMGVGDANGADPVPDASQKKLINERRRAPLNQLKVDPANNAIIIAEQVIPAEVGGFWIREIALYDSDGDMVAVANCAPSYKPALTQGSGRTQIVRINLLVSNTSNVELKIDPSVVLATRAYVDGKVADELNRLDHKQSVRVATSTDIKLSGLQTVDGIELVDGDRVLVKSQTAGKENGLYTVVASGNWLRSQDADSDPEVTAALIVSVEEGTLLADTIWQLLTGGQIRVGTTPLVFQNITAGFAPLLSPALLGTPTVPTPAVVANNKLAANTEFVQAALAAGLSQKLSLSGGQLKGKLKAKVGAANAGNTNDSGFVFDDDTGLFSPTDGTLQLAANGEVIFQHSAGGAAQFFRGVRVPKGPPNTEDNSSVAGYTFAEDGDSGLFAEGGGQNSGSDLVFRIDKVEAGRIKAQMKSGAQSGWTRLLSGKILQWTQISFTPVAGASMGWTAVLPTSFLNACHQAFAIQGNGAGVNKFQITTEGLGLGSVNGFAFSEDTGARIIRVWAIGE
ncbi:Tail fiber protein H [Pseudomonas amygdali pv. photiniae]|uniref:Tail fiber protein H n=1 Tax=Pseudomonas amygdali pv. photiniae TaxID=251724 RepID=A0A0P9U3U3_PSEA0|nr:phage tail protein [Pseudomonas amygdali]KPX79136.1 Tail fiber protein H [Pseudomonas amygdali pv. photiniae]RMS39576.1 Tail fiber protein H [Pseudomonas amygdali pv. photiniae]